MRIRKAKVALFSFSGEKVIPVILSLEKINNLRKLIFVRTN